MGVHLRHMVAEQVTAPALSLLHALDDVFLKFSGRLEFSLQLALRYFLLQNSNLLEFLYDNFELLFVDSVVARELELAHFDRICVEFRN